MEAMRKTAVTGGIGEGKSTVLRYLEEEGQAVVSADALAREVFLSPPVQEALARLLRRPGAVQPAELREAIAEQPNLRREVNRLMHPPVLAAIRASDAAFVEVPLLVEAGLVPAFESAWVVTCGVEEQRRRLRERYQDEAIVEGFLASQLPTRAKIPFADEIIRTNQPFERVKADVREALR